MNIKQKYPNTRNILRILLSIVLLLSLANCKAGGGSGGGGDGGGGGGGNNGSNITPDAFIPTTRFGVYNNCAEPAWVQQKYDPSQQAQPAEWLKQIQPGQFYNYNITQAGLGSFNIWAKFGCDSTGQHCKRGQVVDPMKSGACDPVYGCQPDIETKFEATFGCSLSDSSACAKDAKGLPLGTSTFFDGSLVDGFTYKMSIKVIKDSTESNPQCVNVATPTFSFDGCPSTENLSATKDKWSINTSDPHWIYPSSSSSAAWNPQMVTAITSIGQSAWATGVTNLKNIINSYPFPTSYTCSDQTKNQPYPSVTVDLTSQNLLVKNPNDGSIVGCASPANELYGSRRWGTLGLVAQCTNPSSNFSEPTFDDLQLMYANPYSDNDLMVGTHVTAQTPLFKKLNDFCNANPVFCKVQDATGAARPGLASIIGHAGPVSTSKYVNYIRSTADQFYAWQYDDFSGTRVCSSTTTKIAVILCGN